MRKLAWSEAKIDAKECKSLYFQSIEAFGEAKTRKLREKELRM
jgi:hypothetical protein